MNPQIAQLELPALIDNLEDLEGRRTPIGWSPDDAALKTSIERRIMELIATPPDAERREKLRIPCVISVKVRCKDFSVRATTRDLGVGGVFIEMHKRMPVGTTVDIEIRGNGTDEHGLRVRGTVAWTIDDDAVEDHASDDGTHRGIGVSFASQYNERNERRLRRFILELLRHRVDHH